MDELMDDFVSMCINSECECKKDGLTRALRDGHGVEEVEITERPSGLVIPKPERDPDEGTGHYL